MNNMQCRLTFESRLLPFALHNSTIITSFWIENKKIIKPEIDYIFMPLLSQSNGGKLTCTSL